MTLSNELKSLFDQSLKELIISEYSGSNVLSRVVSYALSGEGKRVRPVFSLLCSSAVGGRLNLGLRAALAVEMVHTYSLIHDDLPCMDNDSLRRGRPTCHVEFSEDHALLAGDALLTDAFAILSDKDFCSELTFEYNSETTVNLVRELTLASGSRGMVLGQEMDLFWTGKNESSIEDLHQIHIKKTGMLIGAACAMGGLCGGADAATVTSLRSFGMLVGHAFQILDDLIDGKEGTGKSSGKDAEMGKLTYLSHMDPETARSTAKKYTDAAIGIIRSLDGFNGADVEDFAMKLLSRGC